MDAILIQAVVVLGVGVAALGAWLARRYALSRAMLDQPGARRSHAVPTPRGGGVGIVVVVAATAILGISTAASDGVVALWAFLVGLLAVAGIGWWDDHRDVPAIRRLAVHLLAGGAAALALLGWPAGHWEWVVLATAVVWVVAMVNLWNFMDGINGIATAQAAVVAMALACLPGALDGAWWLLSIGLAAGCVGFLPFNVPRARIFLGDVGSGALGFSLGVLLLNAALRSDPGQVPLLLLLPVVFLVDAGATLSSRVVRGRRWWEGHREHVYQWAVRSGHSHAKITFIYTMAAVLAAIMAGSLWPVSGGVAVVAFLAVATGLLFVWVSIKRIWLKDLRRRRDE